MNLVLVSIFQHEVLALLGSITPDSGIRTYSTSFCVQAFINLSISTSPHATTTKTLKYLILFSAAQSIQIWGRNGAIAESHFSHHAFPMIDQTGKP